MRNGDDLQPNQWTAIREFEHRSSPVRHKSGEQYANFTPSASPWSITTVFTVDSHNNLLWSNINFYNNEARFCVMGDGTIVAGFVDPALALTGFLFVVLSLTGVSSCVAQVGRAVLSGPTGP